MRSELGRRDNILNQVSPLKQSVQFEQPLVGLVIPDVDTQLNDFKSTLKRDHPTVGEVLDRNEWGYSLLQRFGQNAPKDLQGSLRVATITGKVIEDLNRQDPAHALTQDEYDVTFLGGAMQDVSRGYLPKEILYEVYTSGKRWRDDPDTWQWGIVHGHTGESAQLVEDAGGDSRIKQIVLYHHILKRNGAYTSADAVPFDQIDDPVVKRGVEIVAAADVAEAVSKNYKGEGRGYLDDSEFVGRDLLAVVTGELDVDPEIAKLAVKHTLRVKGLASDEKSPEQA